MERYTILQVMGVDHTDYPDYTDAYALEVFDRVEGRNLTEQELEEFNNNSQDLIQQYAAEQMFV